MNQFALALLFSFFTLGHTMAQHNSAQQGMEYDDFQARLKMAREQATTLPHPQDAIEAMALVDYYADLIDNQELNKVGDDGAELLRWLGDEGLSLEERWRLALATTGLTTPSRKVWAAVTLVVSQVQSMLDGGQASRQLVSMTLAYEQQVAMLDGTQGMLDKARLLYPDIAKNFEQVPFRPMTREQLRDLYYFTPQWSRVRDSHYADGVKLFLFCRRDRSYPCLFVAKDQFDLPLMDKNSGQLWHQPALAASSRGFSSRVRNGQTPTGVQTIDSVMPEANRVESFGKFRRVILNWLPSEDQEDQTLALLPPGLHEQQWWREANVSRDVGRVDLRIHGTGKLNDDATSTFYPFRKTSGCISQREGVYGAVEYRDQRLLLDTLMSAMGLQATFNNETSLKGVLYLVEMDDAKRAVSFDDVRHLLQAD